MQGKNDFTDWLLPEACEKERDRARGLVTFFRLLRDDSGARLSDRVELRLCRARQELERSERGALASLFEDLLRVYLRAALPLDTFADPGLPRQSLQATWSRLERHRSTHSWIPGVPPPGEPPLESVARFLRAVERVRPPSAWTGYWRAFRAQAAERDRAVETWAVFERSVPRGAWRARAIAAQVRALLDLGAVSRARALLARNRRSPHEATELARLASWTALLLGDPEVAADLVRGRGAFAGGLPVPLVELRRHVPAWAPLLESRANSNPENLGAQPSATAWETCAQAANAALWGVFALLPDQRLRVLAFDVSARSRETVERALAARRGVWRAPASPEARVLATGESVREHRTRSAPLEDALAGPAVQARVWTPIDDGEGEVLGWSLLEAEHHLLPSAERLGAVSRAWRGRVERGTQALEPVERVSESAPQGDRLRGDGLRDPRGEWLEALLSRAGWRLARRRAFLFEVTEAHERCIAEHGDGLSELPAPTVARGRRALSRARRTTGVVIYAARPELAVHPEARSGICLPLLREAEVLGFLVIESQRANDFRSSDVEELRAFVSSELDGFRAAQFRSWHRASFGEDVHFDPRARVFAAGLSAWERAARAGESFVVLGPSGAGKAVLARWLLFVSGAPEWSLDRSLPSGASGRVLLDDADEIPAAELLEWPKRLASGRLRQLIVVSRRPVLERSWATRSLLPWVLAVPGLGERRDEIPGLIARLSERRAHALGEPVIHFPDESLALLWKQHWPGHVRELETWIERFARLFPGRAVRPCDVEAIARGMGVRLRKKLPSQRPRAADLRAALQLTVRRTGRWNLSRAARYLGWDRATLATRLRERGVRPSGSRGPQGAVGSVARSRCPDKE